MAYSEKLLDHYEHPRNVGSMDKDAAEVGTGMVGAPACGDVMKLQIKIGKDRLIEDAKFKTYGCGSAIASSSLATEWLKGSSVDQAATIKNTQIVEELALPPVKIHCSILAEDAIKSKLFAGWPIVVAWAVGGVAILVLADRLQHRRPSDAAAVDGAAGGTQSAGRANVIGTALEAITPRQALIIGLAQVVAMWPGTSRSLVTIVAAVLVGLSVSAAVEFSFLLGLGTLGAATAYEALKNGSLLVDSYGGAEIVIGLVVAFITAAVAITWMVRWLERRSLAIFGWYRLAIAGVGAVLLLTGTITSTPG